MLTLVWPLVATVTESHDKLMQSTWGGGSCGNGGPWRSCPLPCVCSSELLREKWGWRGCPHYPSCLPLEHRRNPQEGPDPRAWGLRQSFPTLLTCFFPTRAPSSRTKPGSCKPSSNLA